MIFPDTPEARREIDRQLDPDLHDAFRHDDAFAGDLPDLIEIHSSK